MWTKLSARLIPRKPQARNTTINPADILSSLYTSWIKTQPNSYYFCDPVQLKTPGVGNRLPVPPAHMRMGYGERGDEIFLQLGETSASALRSIMQAYGISLKNGAAVLDWGCATGRVLRWFAQEAQDMEFWGADQDEAAIVWAKENLSPPFHFVTCTAYPHLPFMDNKFSLIYGLSVFTHLEHFRDLWLMEMHRVMQPGAHAIFTINDEHTVQYFEENGRPLWIPVELTLSEIPKHEIIIVHGELWHQTYTFFASEYIRKE